MQDVFPAILGAVGRDGYGAGVGIDLGPIEAADFLAATPSEHQQLNNAPIIVFRCGKPNPGQISIGERPFTRAALLLLVGADDGIVVTEPLANRPIEHCRERATRAVASDGAAVFCECRELGGYISAANAGKRETVERFPVAL